MKSPTTTLTALLDHVMWERAVLNWLLTRMQPHAGRKQQLRDREVTVFTFVFEDDLFIEAHRSEEPFAEEWVIDDYGHRIFCGDGTIQYQSGEPF